MCSQQFITGLKHGDKQPVLPFTPPSLSLGKKAQSVEPWRAPDQIHTTNTAVTSTINNVGDVMSVHLLYPPAANVYAENTTWVRFQTHAHTCMTRMLSDLKRPLLMSLRQILLTQHACLCTIRWGDLWIFYQNWPNCLTIHGPAQRWMVEGRLGMPWRS